MAITDFDQWARNYDASVLQPAYRAAHVAVLRRACRLTSPRRVLDVGCGTGRLLRAASALFPGSLLVGVDLSRGMLTASLTSAGTSRFAPVQAAVEHLPFGDGTFDLVVSTASFRHWADHCAGLREMGRVLVPGGLFCLADLLGRHRRTWGAMFSRYPRLAPALEQGLAPAGLHVLDADTVDGFGPVATITVVLARRSASRGSPISLPPCRS